MMQKELKKILYVEDEEDIRTIAQIALEDLGGFTVKLCATGYEALTEVVNFAPDLILLDIMMPGLDGFETLKRIRRLPNMQKVPVIFLTARIQEHEMMTYKQQDILGIITKPFDPTILAQTIRDYWSNYHE